jgi:hypothetical protein
VSDGALLHVWRGRKHYGGSGRRGQGGHVCNVGVLLQLLSLLPATLTALAFGRVLPLLLLVLVLTLLLVSLLLLPARVTMLMLHHRDLIGILLARAMPDGLWLVLCYHSTMYISQGKIIQLSVPSDDGYKHLPFLREGSKGYHSLELCRDPNVCSTHASIGSSNTLKVCDRVGVSGEAGINTVLKVFENCGGWGLAIGCREIVLELLKSDGLHRILLQGESQPKHHMLKCHIIILVPVILASIDVILLGFGELL